MRTKYEKVKIEYDEKVDALYIRFIEKQDEVATTKRVSEDIAFDFNPAGKLVGIEVLSASEYFEPPFLAEARELLLTTPGKSHVPIPDSL